MKVYNPEYMQEISWKDKNVKFFSTCSLFLAGTIDNGDSTDWQKELIDYLSNYGMPYVILYNPRRNYWNKNASDKETHNQIDWEQKYLDDCDYIIMVLQDNSKSPISLMELGQYSKSGKIIVFCNENFYRYQNVKYLCEKENIPLINNISIDNIGNNVIKIIRSFK